MIGHCSARQTLRRQHWRSRREASPAERSRRTVPDEIDVVERDAPTAMRRLTSLDSVGNDARRDRRWIAIAGSKARRTDLRNCRLVTRRSTRCHRLHRRGKGRRRDCEPPRHARLRRVRSCSSLDVRRSSSASRASALWSGTGFPNVMLVKPSGKGGFADPSAKSFAARRRRECASR